MLPHPPPPPPLPPPPLRLLRLLQLRLRLPPTHANGIRNSNATGSFDQGRLVDRLSAIVVAEHLFARRRFNVAAHVRPQALALRRHEAAAAVAGVSIGSKRLSLIQAAAAIVSGGLHQLLPPARTSRPSAAAFL
jgi:hypothetical protein